MPRCQTITTKQGKVIIKPLNKEIADVLKSLSSELCELQEESLMWPRFIIRGVPTSMAEESIQEAILDQNQELGIEAGCIQRVPGIERRQIG